MHRVLHTTVSPQLWRAEFYTTSRHRLNSSRLWCVSWPAASRLLNELGRYNVCSVVSMMCRAFSEPYSTHRHCRSGSDSGLSRVLTARSWECAAYRDIEYRLALCPIGLPAVGYITCVLQHQNPTQPIVTTAHRLALSTNVIGPHVHTCLLN